MNEFIWTVQAIVAKNTPSNIKFKCSICLRYLSTSYNHAILWKYKWISNLLLSIIYVEVHLLRLLRILHQIDRYFKNWCFSKNSSAKYAQWTRSSFMAAQKLLGIINMRYRTKFNRLNIDIFINDLDHFLCSCLLILIRSPKLWMNIIK